MVNKELPFERTVTELFLKLPGEVKSIKSDNPLSPRSPVEITEIEPLVATTHLQLKADNESLAVIPSQEVIFGIDIF